MGHRVSGSDLHEHTRLDRLRLLGVECLVPQVAENVPADADAVVMSSAVPRTNVEVRRRRGSRHPGAVARRRARRHRRRRGAALGVAGTHGKTTTTSMITLILRAADLHPSFLVGSELNEVGTNAGLDSGRVVDRRGRRERRHVPAPRPRRRDRHQHRSRPPLVLGRHGAPRGRVRTVRRRGRRTGRAVRRRSEDPRARRDPTRGDHLRLVRRTRATAPATTAVGAAARRSSLDRDGEELGEVRLPVVGHAQRAERRRRRRDDPGARGGLRVGRRTRSPASAAWRAGSSTGARSTASP